MRSDRTVEPVEPVRASLLTSDLRTFILQQINIQIPPKLCRNQTNNNNSQTTPGPEVAAEKCVGFYGAKVCSTFSCLPGEHRVCPLNLPFRDWLIVAVQSCRLSYLRCFSPSLIESSVTATLCLKIAHRPLLPRRDLEPSARTQVRNGGNVRRDWLLKHGTSNALVHWSPLWLHLFSELWSSREKDRGRGRKR